MNHALYFRMGGRLQRSPEGKGTGLSCSCTFVRIVGLGKGSHSSIGGAVMEIGPSSFIGKDVEHVSQGRNAQLFCSGKEHTSTLLREGNTQVFFMVFPASGVANIIRHLEAQNFLTPSQPQRALEWHFQFSAKLEVPF